MASVNKNNDMAEDFVPTVNPDDLKKLESLEKKESNLNTGELSEDEEETNPKRHISHSIDGMIKYVMCGFDLDVIEQKKYDVYSKLGPKLMPEGNDPVTCLAKYQEVLADEFGSEVGVRFREMYEHNSKKIPVGPPYFYFDGAVEELFRMKLLFDNCYNSLVKYNIHFNNEKEKTELRRMVQDLAYRVKNLENRLGLTYHAEAN
jgi:hypothetical protein